MAARMKIGRRERGQGILGTLASGWKARGVRGLWDAIMSTVGVGNLPGTYAVLDPRRKILPNGWQQYLQRNYSANELSQLSLPQLRALCRKIERDNCTARAIVEGLVAQTVGTGIGLEPDTGDTALDKLLGDAFKDWMRTCDVTGRRSLFALQGQAVREWCVAGAHLWRWVVLPERAKLGQCPLAILPLSTEWLATGLPPSAMDGITRVPGIDLDLYGRPVTYHLLNPELFGSREPEQVPAAEITHGFEHRRALQNAGEPILAPGIERLFQEGDLVDAELKSAVNCAAMAMVITSEYHEDLDTTAQGTDTDPAASIGIGATARLFPGEDVKAFSHNRPSQQIAPFRTTLRGDLAGACRISQRWLDRDYSRQNYSSQRGDGQDSERLLAPLIEEIGHSTIGDAYLRVMPFLCAIIGRPVPKRRAYRLIPDGQPYVDPIKDAEGSALAIAFGFSTYEDEIGKKGKDRREVWKKLAAEIAEAKAMDLPLSSPAGPAATTPDPEETTGATAGSEDDSALATSKKGTNAAA